MKKNKEGFTHNVIKTEDLTDNEENYIGTMYQIESNETGEINKMIITPDGDVGFVVYEG